MRLKAAFLLVAGLVTYPTIGAALNFNILDRICIGELVDPRPLLDRVPVPVGCEVVDCCPGCPGPPDFFEWRIRLDGKVLGTTELRFEEFGAQQMRQLKISGKAKLDGDRIIIEPGESRITGLPAKVGERVPVGFFKSAIRQDAASKLPSSPPRGGDPDAGSVPDGVTVQQFFRGIRVNNFSSRYLLRRCISLPASDHIRVQNNGGDNVVVMLDARSASGGAGCTNDQVLRTTAQKAVGNLLANAGCGSEISIFSSNNAMSFQTGVTTWTNAVGNLHTVSLQPVINVPVTVWIATAGAGPRAVNDIANANLLYSVNKVGVQFTATQNDVSGNADAVTIIGNTDACSTVAAIKGSAFFTPNRLNIYYVNGAFTGVNCARAVPGDGNISHVGTIANLATLTHEIGHAFGLRPAGSGGHTNGLAGFGSNNIMQGGGLPTRDHFSLGQAFRMNTHSDAFGGTMLIQNGLRPGPGRACAPLTTNNICPALNLDWTRP